MYGLMTDGKGREYGCKNEKYEHHPGKSQSNIQNNKDNRLWFFIHS